jgi:hypothetical protein
MVSGSTYLTALSRSKGYRTLNEKGYWTFYEFINVDIVKQNEPLR